MQVTVEMLDGLKRRLNITIPSESIEGSVTKELLKIAKNRRFNGFRRGRVPVSIVAKVYGNDVREEVLVKTMHHHFLETVVREKMNPVGAPTFSIVESTKKDRNLVFEASFEVYPEFQLGGMENILVEKPVVKVEDEDVEEMLGAMRKQRAKWVEVNEPATEGNRVHINFWGQINQEDFEGNKAENFRVELGQGCPIPGFEESLKGKTSGVEFETRVDFPEDYHAEALKGKTAIFSIEVNKIEACELPESDDKFVTQFGINEGGLAALRLEIRKNMERELKDTIKKEIKKQVIDGMVRENAIEAPRALIDKEIDMQLKQAANQRREEASGAQPSRKFFEKYAERRVVIGLLLSEVIKTEEIKVDNERVTSLIQDIASAYDDPSEVITRYEKNEKIMENMRSIALEEQAIDAILAKVKISNKEMNFSNFMNPKVEVSPSEL